MTERGIAGLVLLLFLLSCSGGCASLRGARLYAAGSQALERGEVELAIERLERATALVPQASEIQNHLGLAYARAGRSDEAARAFGRAVALDCRNTAARQNLKLVAGEIP